MSVSEGPVASRSLVNRIKGILMQPSAEWRVIDTEPATVGGLYASYIAPLAAIGPIASAIGMGLIGISVPFVGHYQIPLMTAIEFAVVRYVVSLIGVYVLALVVDALAPTFGGQKSMIQALKVVAYSSTAAWLAGIFAIVPALAILGIVGLYSLYLLYLGLPILMKAPADKALAYTVVAIVCAIVIYIVIGAVSGIVLGGVYSRGLYAH